MKAPNLTEAFKRDQSGVLTVDWAVLAAAFIGLGIVVMVSIGTGITGLGDAIVTDLDTRQMG